MKILLIIPAYNEENCITKVIDELVERYPQYDYIIVNDFNLFTDMQKESYL